MNVKDVIRIYHIWKSMRQRCTNRRRAEWERYGSRGIEVCSEWDQDFETFYNWAVAQGYKHGLQIGRIDNDKGYHPENCRWETPEQQSNNTVNNRHITAWGETKTLARWGRDERAQVCSHAIAKRLDNGWEPEKAISQRSKFDRLLTAWGETKPLSDWPKDSRAAVDLESLRQRLRAGWHPEKAISQPKRKRAPSKPK